ncbi:hypothetical protein RMN57_13020 [Kitasatospora sp. CM 4170]|uniref:Uncharacterized protein n=1 Tax=Kitasatospora aburaviensis TaxID=67265 RepID=A0ABW1F5F5_9ACTN|nr:hypothetical protein [Kitasatospora sp. CM 4170]WNM45575.1 hypothetical protein RMN57_13020 [Kitasatospora sp. CM 4170]
MTTSPLLLFVVIDGVNHPLAACRWVRYEPNGCATGSALGTTATSPEQAAAEFEPVRRNREREHRRGVRYRLVSPDQWRDTVKPCLLGECNHVTQTTRPAA